jgi:hypothetical protein
VSASSSSHQVLGSKPSLYRISAGVRLCFGYSLPQTPLVWEPLALGLPLFNQDSPMIISDKLSQKESLCLLTVLEKHRSTFGYSLQDLKGIGPTLCTHCIPTNLDSIPSREPQRRLNNAMREVIKKQVLKLLHAGIIYPVPHSRWVSPIQIVPKRGA